MNYANSKIPYCKAAIFICNFCLYSTIIYSDTEWLEVTEELFFAMNECKEPAYNNCDVAVIYRADIDEEIPLHRQMDNMPTGKLHCGKCIRQSQIHSSELIVHCHECLR